MENIEDDFDEDEIEWEKSYTDQEVLPAVAAGPSFCKEAAPTGPRRVILHFDLDCFYAQVEMIRNPALQDVPLGIQQKYIIVTCNYVARKHGVTKLMSLTDAKEKCPQLVVVKGEDLTRYREMSYKVTELLMSYYPLVERLGFDENFVDITKMVERRLVQTPVTDSCSFKGHIYNHNNGDINPNEYPSLAIGSHIAAELRAAIYRKLGLTSCAGIATNKLLAKLVSGTFKPNQQTTLLPENIKDIMGSLSGLRKVPGVGRQTHKRLQALRLVTVQDLQLFPLASLVGEFGGPSAQRLKNLSLGIDESPVTPTGAPQSLSDEDSFKKMSSTKEVLQKINDLLNSLLERMHKDGRQPQTLRLTIRKYNVTNKWSSRESRQCPIPNHIGQKISSGSSDVLVQLVTTAMKLFHKMVDSKAAFHLTLLNVCFTNLLSRLTAAGSKGSIMSFLTSDTSFNRMEGSSQTIVDDLLPSGGSRHVGHGFGCEVQENGPKELITQYFFQPTTCVENLSSAKRLPTVSGPAVPAAASKTQEEVHSTESSSPDDISKTAKLMCHLPQSVNLDTFTHLPDEIQKELLSSAYANSLRVALTPGVDQHVMDSAISTPPISNSCPLPKVNDLYNLKEGKETVYCMDSSNKQTLVNLKLPPGTRSLPERGNKEDWWHKGMLSSAQSSHDEFPADVDQNVFSELPIDIQRELMSEWRQQMLVSKVPSSRKQGRGSAGKDGKVVAKGSQANNLLKYFKPT